MVKIIKMKDFDLTYGGYAKGEAEKFLASLSKRDLITVKSEVSHYTVVKDLLRIIYLEEEKEVK